MPYFAAQKHSQFIEASDQFDYGAAQLMPDSKVMFATVDSQTILKLHNVHK